MNTDTDLVIHESDYEAMAEAWADAQQILATEYTAQERRDFGLGEPRVFTDYEI